MNRNVQSGQKMYNLCRYCPILVNDLVQCSSTFFGSRHPVRLKKIWLHPHLAKMTIWGTLSSKKTKKVVNSIFGGTPDTSSRHPGWEPLI